MNILVLETSTTSAKALLYNTNTQAYQWESKPFDKLSFNGTIHDGHKVYKDTLDTGYKLLKKIGFKDSIDVISIVTTWHSLIVSNKDLSEISKCYLWSSLVGETYVGELIDSDKVYAKTGCVASSMYPFYKLQFLNDEGLINEDSMVLDQGSYNYYQLTGEVLTTAEMASGTGFYNSEEASYDKELLELINVDEDQLPKVYSGEKNKYHSKDYHPLDGFMNKDTIVLPATPDGAMNQLGSLGLELNKMTLSVGTSGALRVLSPKHIHSPTGSTWSYSLNGQALIGAATSGACNCIDLVKEEYFKSESYEEIEKQLNSIPLDLKTGIYLPFVYGERSPGFNNKRQNGFVGDFKASIYNYNSALEGVLFNLYQCYLDVINLVGKPKEIHLSGGILNSSYWSQMCSDILGEPILIDQVLHSSMYGGVVYAYSELGLEIRNLFTKTYETIRPNLDRKSYYSKRFKSYISLYNQG